MSANERLPRLIAFDLDYTLWDLWIDTHVRGPVKRKGDDINRIYDANKQELSFYRDVPDLLAWLHSQPDVHVAACSRTHAPDLARQALDQLLISTPNADQPVKRAIDLFDTLEIYPGSKLQHFRKLHSKTGISYEEMLFFDDESRNREVEQLGVTFVLVPSSGTTRKLLDEGVAEWRRRRDGTSATQSAGTKRRSHGA